MTSKGGCRVSEAVRCIVSRWLFIGAPCKDLTNAVVTTTRIAAKRRRKAESSAILRTQG